MTADTPPPEGLLEQAERLMRDEVDAGKLTPEGREALLRRILQRIGGVAPLSPVAPAASSIAPVPEPPRLPD